MQGYLALENIGPFVKTKLELKPITILTGISGSGKSFILKVLYSILTATKLALSEVITQTSQPGLTILPERATLLLEILRAENIVIQRIGSSKASLEIMLSDASGEELV